MVNERADGLHLYGARPSPVREWLTARFRGPRILDVGCGTGYLGRSRPDLHWSGIDINPRACDEASPYYDDVECISALDLAGLEKYRGQFDEVVCCDILEHFDDPGAVLTQVSEVLRPGGSLLVAIPNIVHWAIRKAVLQGRWMYTDEGPLDRTHLRFFTLSTAADLLADAGFEVRETGVAILAPRPLRWADPVLRRGPTLFSTHFLAVSVDTGRSRL